MTKLRDLPIRHKLTGIVLIAGFTAFLVVCIIFIGVDQIEMRRQAVYDLQMLADVIGANTTAALTFNSENDAVEMLTALKVQTHVVEACIYTADGTLFARYWRNKNLAEPFPPSPPPEAHVFRDGELMLTRRIMLNGKNVGAIFIRSDLDELTARTRLYLFILSTALILSSLVAFFVVSRLQRVITRPVHKLTAVARQVSERRDYSVRAIQASRDEVGYLIQVFNEMLVNIQDRDAALRDARDGLERRVKERTAELESEIAEKRRAEESLRDREGLLRATLEATGNGILVVDNTGHVTHWNAAFLELWRIPRDMVETKEDDRLIQYVLAQLKEPEIFVQKVRALYQSSEESFDVLEFVDERVFERYSRPLVREEEVLGRVWSFRDVTGQRRAEQARQQLQEQLERAERMESLGLLAGGVAHDLNNMLGPVVGYSELLARELPSDSKSALKARKIGKSAEEAALVIQDLLTLARRGRYEMQPIEFNAVIQTYLDSPSFEKLQERHANVSVNVRLSPGTGVIVGSGPHLGKVIMNLISNAFEAMPTGGTLSVESERVRINNLYGGYQDIDEGEYAIVRVRDTGSGIAPDDISRIFEPYFSKKKMGRSGSGLGLSVVYGIVKDHKGYYDIKSEIGKGTEFILYFPIADKQRTESEGQSEGAVKGGSESILIVDDSHDQREMAREIIESLGYTSYTAENGHAGLDLLRAHPVNLVLLDMIMEPGFDGLDTYRAMLHVRPGQRAVVVSGFSTTERVQAVLDLGAYGFVKKPYNIDTLARTIRAALDTPPDAKGLPAAKSQEILTR